MASVNGAQAIAWMRAKVTNIPGTCLNTVWQAYGSFPSLGPHAGQYPTALDGWNYATKRHTDTNPPAGVPVYYGVSPTRTDANKSAGDVVLSLGGGLIIGTDAAGTGRIGIRGILQRASDIRRPYLGWTEDFLGYDVVLPGATTGVASNSVRPVTSLVSAKRKARKMNFWSDTNGTIYYGAYPIPDPDRYRVLVRYDESLSGIGNKRDEFNAVQAAWIQAALAANGMHS